ncbi:uncharacterized protein Z518_00037 [Rhinocladiella mackenziei CBS 650.93]|uniref:Integral membrane protein, Mpv17/PMP22 family n=1 Tax=Rhinocladiella mackenziei CBS 650.93 TaxID=1442369 RepID=A0A0D2ISK5_9EURO|nr:uncharacterized protein Z518_00037 [Rhinocladiella mackenziei CBS 650.93]KIX08959.1 hypothetical protein Z518_00037 [Rhinocladiella mackenziei CBS 650.93]
MSSRLPTVTAQAAAISALSNALAQGLTAYREQALSSIDPVAFFHFIILAVITTPPNYQWQLVLEETFPSNAKKDTQAVKKKDDDVAVNDKDDEKETLSLANTIAKLLLDQSIGASLNTIFFIVMINLLRGATWSQALTAVQRDFFPMLIAGYKFWPFVTLLNLVIVPFEYRMLVGSLAGLIWGVIVSLMEF